MLERWNISFSKLDRCALKCRCFCFYVNVHIFCRFTLYSSISRVFGNHVDVPSSYSHVGTVQGKEHEILLDKCLRFPVIFYSFAIVFVVGNLLTHIILVQHVHATGIFLMSMYPSLILFHN